jgi:hypothetical protein
VSPTLEARLWAKVVKGPGPADCWIFTGGVADDGYGRERALLHRMQHALDRGLLSFDAC